MHNFSRQFEVKMKKKDEAKIQSLAQEGKQISKIMEEDFPEYAYWDIYEAVHAGGGKSARGVKKTITNRLNTLAETRTKEERYQIIEEVGELVWHLYESLKTSQKKLDTIRKTIG